MHLEFWLDLRTYMRYSGPDDGERIRHDRPVHLEMQVTKDYHRLEKALTLPQPKRPYGSDPRSRLDDLVERARRQDLNAPFVQYATSATRAQDSWNRDGFLDDIVAPVRRVENRGISDPDAFFGTRRSVRNFAHREVDRALVESAVQMAINTPSVCNRQPWRLRLFDDPVGIARALAHQNGNAGFAQTVPMLGLVTAEVGLFAGPSERNQVYIDGGLFAMSIVWALHALGLDSCMLNMSLSNKKLTIARRSLGIPPSEAIIMFIAIGYPSEGHRVARSPRRTIREVLS